MAAEYVEDKTETLRAERAMIDAAVLAEGGRMLWLDLRSCGSEQRHVDKLFRRLDSPS